VIGNKEMSNKELIQQKTKELLIAIGFSNNEVEQKMQHSCRAILGFLRTGKPEIDSLIMELEDQAWKYLA
jgi:hypothetical protein